MPGQPPALGFLQTTSGTIKGTLRVAAITAPIGVSAATDLDASLEVSGDANGPIAATGMLRAGMTVSVLNANQGVSFGSMAPTSTLRINGTLPSGKSITVGPAGTANLGGQVIINGANQGGAWAGTVVVGGTTLAPDASGVYTTPSPMLGLGAVGLVPFNLYRQDCFPPQATETSAPMIRNVAFDDPDPAGDHAPVRLRFYGPIALPESVPAIGTVKVYLGAVLPENDVTADWRAALGPVPFNVGRNELRLWFNSVEGSVPPQGTYNVVAALDGTEAVLRCALDLAPDPAVVPFTYTFTVTDQATGCGSYELDFNADGVVNPDDIGDFVTAYFMVPVVAGPGGYAISCPANAPPYHLGYQAAYTLSGAGQCAEPNPDNLGDYITQYFEECQ